MIIQITVPNEKAAIAASILHALTEWFGIPESTENYISESKDLPFFACTTPTKNIANNLTANVKNDGTDTPLSALWP